MTKITIYKNNSCGACAEVVPLVQRLAKRKGIQVEIVDLDKCHTKQCDAVRYVPLVKIGGREVSLEKVAELLK